MIEVHQTYDLRPDIDPQAYGEFCQQAVRTMLQTPGCLEFHAQRNLLGSPHVRTAVVWEDLSAWARFAESETGRTMMEQFLPFVTHVQTELWGPSPVLPEPIRAR